MARMKLSTEALQVSTFEPVAYEPISDPRCCTGCVSGCGINPTAGGCESGGGDGTILAY